MSTRSKGNKHENEAKEILELKGYIVIKSPRTMKMIGKGRFMSMANDYWNLYDLCAKKKGRTKWVQVKSTPSGVSEAKTDIARFDNEYNCVHEQSEIWQRVAKKGWVVHYFDKKGKKWMKVFLNLKGEGVEAFKVTEGKKNG